MPRSRESIIAELNARKIGYNDEMSHQELLALLKKAESVPSKAGLDRSVKMPEEKRPESEVPIDYSNVRCGLSTIQDHERRITILERKNARTESQ